MIAIQGKWFDGKSSAQIDTVLKVYENGFWELVHLGSNKVLLKQSREPFKVSARLANTPRHITLPYGGSFETLDNDGVDAVLSSLKQNHWSLWVHLLESQMRYVVVAVLLAVALAFWGVRYGVPVTARVIAEYLPANVLNQAGEQTLKVLDKVLFKPSELSSERVSQVRKHLQKSIDGHPHLQLKVSFRKGGNLGPNAFALPSGHIVFTDEMIRIAESDDELLAIFAHEVGHVVHRHGMRRLVQDSLLSFAILAVTGDASGVSELFLGLPVVLTELKYSRDFEREADQYALDYLEAHNIPTHHFANIMRRISKFEVDSHGNDGKVSRKKLPSYLSTHPATRERIELFSGREKQRAQ